MAIALKLRTNLAEIGGLIEDYGEGFSELGWLPFVGPWIERGKAASKLLAKVLERRKEGIGGRRARIAKALVALKKPIVVSIDDIDRLTTSEIRDIFKLVRLTANFPNIIYIVAFDRARVEDALAEQGIPGRDYLEKILQIGVDLPTVPASVMNSQALKAIENALSQIENAGPFDQGLWPDVFAEVIRPLLRNMRDVRRYAAAIHGTIKGLGGQAALVDVLALEAIRIFLPDVFHQMHASIEGLTSTSNGFFGNRSDGSHLKTRIELLIKTAGDRGDIVRAMIQRLFLAAGRHIGGSSYGNDWNSRWLRERRVAHEAVLRLYFERVIGEELQSFADGERAWGLMKDRAALDKFLRSLDRERLQDVIASLEAYEEFFGPEHVVPATIVLLNLYTELPERKRGIYDLPAKFAVSRVVLRLLRAIKNPVSVETAVREILPCISGLSGRLELIRIVGFTEKAGHKLVSESIAKALEKDWRAQVRASNPADLAKEGELLTILLVTKRDADEAEPSMLVPDSPQMTLALLRSACNEVLTQGMGSRAVHRSARLAWDTLAKLYGGEPILRERIKSLKAAWPEGEGELLELVNRYLGGWRPKEFVEE